jgi:hypothetical protein
MYKKEENQQRKDIHQRYQIELRSGLELDAAPLYASYGLWGRVHFTPFTT